MKKSIVYLLIITSIFLSACGSDISSKDYETVVSENASLKQQLVEVQLNQLANQAPETDAIAWINASFGDNSLCFSDSEKQYLQCIAGKTYSIATEDLYNLVDDLRLSLFLLTDIEDSIDYQQVFIKFFDPSGICILEVILDRDEDSYFIQSIMCDAIYSDLIIPTLQGIASSDK